jgi:hypothetical protein
MPFAMVKSRRPNSSPRVTIMSWGWLGRDTWKKERWLVAVFEVSEAEDISDVANGVPRVNVQGEFAS